MLHKINYFKDKTHTNCKGRQYHMKRTCYKPYRGYLFSHQGPYTKSKLGKRNYTLKEKMNIIKECI